MIPFRRRRRGREKGGRRLTSTWHAEVMTLPAGNWARCRAGPRWAGGVRPLPHPHPPARHRLPTPAGYVRPPQAPAPRSDPVGVGRYASRHVRVGERWRALRRGRRGQASSGVRCGAQACRRVCARAAPYAVERVRAGGCQGTWRGGPPWAGPGGG
jgi:hypothetical protein